ncbi:MAG: TIGR03663 family protein [Chloroflexi bacterium]|nr:TIGR03663 family protein [Chloroflexota bacterium]
MQDVVERKSFLDTPISSLMTLDWGRGLVILILAAAVLTRLWDLPYRAYNHDESIHTDWSWNLYTGRGYQHNPIYHGPLLYHVTALTFFLFGDNDTTGRLPNALFGIVLVALPLYFRKWLGRKGALITAAMLVISPSVMYYSRFNRHDIYVEVFVVLLALSIWKYFDERKDRWLFATAAFLSLAFTAMETTFIFTAIFAVFLCAHFTYEYLRQRVKWGPFGLALFSAVLGIPFLGLFVAFQILVIEQRPVIDEEWRQIPSFNLSMVLGTFSLPLITPFVFQILNPIWQRLAHTDFLSISAFTDVGVLTQIAQTQPDVMLRVLLVTAAMILLSALLGLWWNGRVWAGCAVLFWPIFILFFKTVFTNGGGFFTGLLGSLGYWLTQQGVARGGQPSYYYLLVMLPEYEILPYVVGIVAVFWYWWRYRVVHLLAILIWLLWIIAYYVGVRPLLAAALPGVADQLVVVFFAMLIPLTFFATFDPDNAASAFPAFIFTWMAGVLVVFSWAGEKMPWLTMHLAIPLAFVSGWALDKLLDVDWRDLVARGAHWIALLVPLGLVLVAAMLVSPPFQGVSLDQLSTTNAFVVSLLLLVAVVLPGLYLIGRRFARHELARVVAVAGVLVMVALTIRFAWMAVFINPDVASETMIYAQGSHDVPIAMDEIRDLSRRLCAQASLTKPLSGECDNGRIKVAYDDDSSWPFVWYLRNYSNAQYYGASPGAPFDAPVVIVGPKNEDAVKVFLGNRYDKRVYKLIWWPLEGYKELTLDRVLGYIRDPQQRADLFTAWFYHQYKESYSAWPYVHNFSFYVRKDVASLLWNYSPEVVPQPQVEDEYTKKFVQRSAVRSIGTEGAGQGQFENPRNLAFDAQGDMYVADSDNSRVEKFDSTGKFLLAWGTKSPENAIGPAGTFSQIWGIAVDSSGDVYVADTWNHRIEKFDSNGKFITMWGSNGDTQGVAAGNPLLFYGPRSIAVDKQGDLYVTDTGNKRVVEFTPDGQPLGQYGGVGSGNGQFQEPVGIAIGPDGSIYVADTWNQRIQKFDSNFNYVSQWPVEAWDTQTVVNKPYLAVDANGNVFASDPEGARIMKFSSDGTLLSVFGSLGTSLSSFNLPTGLAFDAQGNLYVADSGNQRILEFSKP